MALKADIRGMVWKYPDTFVVGREQIRQYASAVKAHDPATHDETAAVRQPVARPAQRQPIAPHVLERAAVEPVARDEPSQV